MGFAGFLIVEIKPIVAGFGSERGFERGEARVADRSGGQALVKACVVRGVEIEIFSERLIGTKGIN